MRASLDSRAATATYWGSVALMIGALFRTRLLPFVDYPQHLAIAATLDRLWLRGAAERALYEQNLSTYNSLFHVVVALLGLIVPIELAGKLAIGAYLVLFAYVLIALLDAAGRPRSRALLLLPLSVGYSFALGFFNFCLGLALGLLVLARVLRALREPPSPRTQLVSAALAVATVYAHVLGAAVAFLLVFVAVAAHRRPIRASAQIALPLLPAVAYATIVFVAQGATRAQNQQYIAFEGQAVPLAKKVTSFLHFVSGLRADGVDELIVAAAIALLFVAAVARRPDAREPPYRLAILVTSVIVYLVLPSYFFSSTFIFGRVALLVPIGLALLLPAPRAPFDRMLGVASGFVAIASALLFFESMNAAREELADVDAVLSAAPGGRRLIGLVFEPKLPSFRTRAVLHAPAYYLALRPGEIAFMFDTLNLPLRRKPGTTPALPDLFELNPQQFDARAPYAAYYDLVLVRLPLGVGDPQEWLFGPAGARLPILAQSGKWFLVDARR